MCMIITDSQTTLVVALKSIRKKEELVNRDLYPEEVTQILDELKNPTILFTLHFSC